MFSSRRSKLSNADSMEGESLFDFLRRKKRVSLQDSINKSIHKESIDMSFSNYHIKEVEPQQIIETTRNQTSRKNAKSSITPKKVTFAEPEQKKLANTARTFIDMISPLKSQKTKVAQKIPIDDQEEQKQQTSSKSGKKKTVQKQFTRRQLNKSIQTMKQTLLNLLKAGKKLKQKSHSLFIDMKPVFKIAEQNQNKIIRRKVEQAKEKLRVMEHCLDQFDVQGGNQIIQSFHRTLSDHLISIQAKNRSTYQKVQIENFNKMRVEKDSKIHQLVNENKDLTQNLNNLQRKIQKLEAALEDTKQKQSQKLQNYQQINQEKLQRISQNLDELKKQNTSLKEKISQLDKQKIQFSKKIKDAVYTKQATQKRLMEQNQKAKSARQEFLLNEIMMLKQQFQRDMTQLTGLYASKQQDHIAVIEDLKRQLQQLRQFNEVNKQNQKKVINQSQAMRSVVNKYRKQNQCLVTDMYRMNEELYQHWLALKDIKTLATRLQLMSRFSRIYQDLAFNEHLFS